MDTQNQEQVKDGVDQDTVDAVRNVGGKYKYGFETDIEIEYAPKESQVNANNKII